MAGEKPDTLERGARIGLAVLAVVSFALGLLGYSMWAGQQPDPRNVWHWLDALYRTALLFVFEYNGPDQAREVPWPMHAARIGAMISILWAGWMAALSLFGERLTPLRLWWKPADALFCGTAPEMLRIGRALRKTHRKWRLALVASGSDSGMVRQFRQECSGLVINEDPATGLSSASAHRVRQCIYAAGSTDEETIRIVQSIASCRSGNDRLRVIALLREPMGPHTLQAARTIQRQRIDLTWIDPTTLAVRTLLEELPPDGSDSLDHRRLHVLLLGSTGFIQALLVQLARTVLPHEQITRITLIAPDARQFMTNCCARFPALAPDFADRDLFAGLHPLVEIETIDRNPWQLSANELDALNASAPIARAYVHADEDEQQLMVVQRLVQLRTRAQLQFRIGAFLDGPRQTGSPAADATVSAETDVFALLDGESYFGEHLDLKALLYDHVYRSGAPDLDAPIQEHEAAWRKASDQWRDIEEWERNSSRRVADHIAVKLRCAGLQELAAARPLPLENARTLRAGLVKDLARLSDLEHRRYCAERMLEDWLPVDANIWNDVPAGHNLKQHHDGLKDLRLNATLVAKVSDVAEVAKDARLARDIAWVLWQASRIQARPSQEASSRRS